MAYNKTNWQNGITPINETNLNKIEAGIEKANNVVLLDSAFDMNDLTEDGKYFNLAANNPTNKPANTTSNAAYIEVLYASDTVILQRWTEHQTNTVWERQKVESNWGGWALMAQEKSYIVAGSNGETITTSVNWGRETLNLTKNRSNKGGAFTLTNGKVKANKKCIVRVSANATLRHDANKYGNISILYNNVSIGEAYDDSASTGWHPISLCSVILQINKNDTISLACGSNTSGVNVTFAGENYTYLTVEEIG